MIRPGVILMKVVSEIYPLKQVSAAVAASLKPGRTGKVMLRIGTR